MEQGYCGEVCSPREWPCPAPPHSLPPLLIASHPALLPLPDWILKGVNLSGFLCSQFVTSWHHYLLLPESNFQIQMWL